FQTAPTDSTFRFGLFQDTDNQLGTGGWGTSDGDFDGESPGAGGDRRVWGRLAYGPGAGQLPQSRIVTAENTDGAVLGGSDGIDSFGSGVPFTVGNDRLAHTLVLTLERTADGLYLEFEVDDSG